MVSSQPATSGSKSRFRPDKKETVARGFMNRLASYGRIFAGLFGISLCGILLLIVYLALFPWRVGRIKAANIYGSVIGRWVLFVSGSYPAKIVGHRRAHDASPAIYISNHTSLLDIFMGIWLSPLGTVGIAKKSVIYYPVFGLLYWLSGHLRIDRSNREAVLRSMKEFAPFIRDNNLTIFMWPEGTRSRDGRLRPFKKGVVHLAIQCGLPIVPMVVKGAHRAWEAHSYSLKRVPIEVEFLPPVDTSQWRVETLGEHLDELQDLFLDALPPDQLPTESIAQMPIPEVDRDAA
jgi:1-acyl-sn-glycerol-3-phosphate acyltransferase